MRKVSGRVDLTTYRTGITLIGKLSKPSICMTEESVHIAEKAMQRFKKDRLSKPCTLKERRKVYVRLIIRRYIR